MKKNLAVLVCSAFIALGIIPGVFSLWKDDIEIKGVVQIFANTEKNGEKENDKKHMYEAEKGNINKDENVTGKMKSEEETEIIEGTKDIKDAEGKEDKGNLGNIDSVKITDDTRSMERTTNTDKEENEIETRNLKKEEKVNN
ncbi:MAG: hypothetical protein PHI90_06340 [Clostridia bacterium]|nr:hypothetical protein [Clostridia bacterium]MDD4048429.1 hypothetical protein [Clostridia bacterium]